MVLENLLFSFRPSKIPGVYMTQCLIGCGCHFISANSKVYTGAAQYKRSMLDVSIFKLNKTNIPHPFLVTFPFLVEKKKDQFFLVPSPVNHNPSYQIYLKLNLLVIPG